ADPALWPLHFTDTEHRDYLNKGYSFFQNKDSDFKNSKREYNTQNRYFSAKHFKRVLKNGERIERKWIMYSKSTGKIYCYFCLESHKSSSEHKNCTINCIQYMKQKEHIDKSLTDQYEQEMRYWTQVLRRVVAVIRFLGERGLALRGSDEHFNSPHNGNYLGALELIAEFDPFLKQHIQNYGDKGQGNVSYLSKTVCEEFIILMGDVLLERIKNEMKDAKYWGLIVDSTPDVSRTNQLSVIFRYYLNSHIYERFNLNAGMYEQLLRNQTIPRIREIAGNNYDDTWFQQDGAAAHYGRDVRAYLDTQFPHRWIGRRGEIEWPARSPDLTPLDYFLWGYLKSKVYATQPQNLDELRNRIMQEAALIDRVIIRNAVSHFYNRIPFCQEAQGLQFEHLR
ncbi:Zinc finger MYM-type protein 1, partial [Cyphomyrmex costatus]